MDLVATTMFVLAAIALLGSPGPGIVTLVAVGRAEGVGKGLHYYAGLQVGLALAAAVSAAGLVTVLMTVPWLKGAMTTLAAVYLAWLGYRVATAPVTTAGATPSGARSPWSLAVAGMALGVTNPKAFIAFASLFGSQRLLQTATSDAWLKWWLCVLVMVVVDLAWLLAGVALRRAAMPPRAERVLNVAFGATILAAAAYTLV